MILVVDSSPLIALARIGRLDILRRLATTVHIPKGVYEEVAVKGHGRPGSLDVEQAEWITVSSVNDVVAVARLSQSIGRGESEAIALAKEAAADFLVLDDATARRAAENEGCRVLGTLGLLLYAKKRNLLPSIKGILDELVSVGFYVDDLTRDSILRFSGELPEP